MIRAIDCELQRMEKKNIEIVNVIKVRDFLDSWFVKDISQNESSLLYPHIVGNKLRLKTSKQIELRELNMANDDDKWFINYIINMPTSVSGKIKDMP